MPSALSEKVKVSVILSCSFWASLSNPGFVIPITDIISHKLWSPLGNTHWTISLSKTDRTETSSINKINFSTPICPIYQNVNAKASIDKNEIKKNLILQLTSPVLWSQSVEAMCLNSATTFIEVGPGKVLQGLVKKINTDVLLESFDI